MAPTLGNGDYVIAQKYRKGLVCGDIAVIHHPHFGNIIKRIQSINKYGNVRVSGDSPMSTETETISAIDICFIKYRVYWRIGPDGLHRLPSFNLFKTYYFQP
ncbi:MAG: hypothetical protein CBB68_13975 [Rhodospirillaceae bacterium TMED8]|nr:hypothetical protein [Magnetovibrio sp.]OUT48069.1 MAG: hypothetical protein CBB68_13975 [Rhodospirillaceae bacterium TMED8]